MENRFEQAMRLMRRHNRQTQEDGFAFLRTHAAEYVDDLITEFGRELDHGLRCWLLELIGEARSPRALPLLVEQLHSSDEALHHWAVVGLELLDTHDSRQALFHARSQGLID